MNHIIKRICVFTCLIAVSACGSPVDEDSLKDTTWTTDCGQNGLTKSEYKFTQSQATYATINYADRGCVTENYRTTWTYDYVLGDDVSQGAGSLSGIKKLDLVIKKIEILPANAAGVTTANSACAGAGGFTAGTAKDVLADAATTAANCGNTAATGLVANNVDATSGSNLKLTVDTKLYQIIAVNELEGDVKLLRLGDANQGANDGLAEDRRPFDLDADNSPKKR